MLQSTIPWRMTAAALTLLLLAFALATPGSADETSIGDWRVGTTAGLDSLYAATINDSQNGLGQFCYPAQGSCLWLLTLPTMCTQGQAVPVLVNSDAGAYYLRLTCLDALPSGHYRYVFSEFAEVDNVIRRAASQIGFAVALADGTFRVVRFSLRGALPALTAMRDAADKRVGTRPGPGGLTGTRDQRL
jgi:hypothetical protein